MAATRVSMRKIREILRLRLGRDLSARAVARSVLVSPTTVSDTVSRATVAGLSWPLPPEIDDASLEARLYPPSEHASRPREEPDWAHINKELRRKGVTLQLLWQEYKQAHADEGYQYSRFCALYRRWRGKLDVVMRQEHSAGEKVFVDFSGDGIEIVDPKTGAIDVAQIFVAVLGASSYTYAEALPAQNLRCWIIGHINAYEFFEGVPSATVPDNTKTAVRHPCFYEPDINRTYLEMARHYDTAVLPARPYKPRDKAKAETGVLLAQRWILAALRNHKFFSIEQANEAIWDKLEELNDRRFQKLETTRRELFETLDRPALQELPARRYEHADWTTPRVNIDYHVDVDRHLYSVPYQLVHEKVEARATTSTVEIFFRGKRVSSHPRSYTKGQHTTLPAHMPKSHQRYLEWTPSRILSWAEKTGPCTRKLAEKIMEQRPHPEQGYRSCLGVMRLGKKYGDERLEAACGRALAIGATSYRSVKSILSNGLDQQALDEETGDANPPAEHKNVRGPGYYH